MNKATEILLEAFEKSTKIDAVKRANKAPAKVAKKKIVEHTEKQQLSEADDNSTLQIYRNVFKYVYEKLSQLDETAFNVYEIKDNVPGYDPDWCEEEFSGDTEDALRAYAQAITDSLMKNFDLNESVVINSDDATDLPNEVE